MGDTYSLSQEGARGGGMVKGLKMTCLPLDLNLHYTGHLLQYTVTLTRTHCPTFSITSDTALSLVLFQPRDPPVQPPSLSPMSLPPPPTSLEDYYPSPPPTPSYFYETSLTLIDTLYGSTGHLSPSLIPSLIQDYYHSNAVFENPVVSVRGTEGISIVFKMGRVVSFPLRGNGGVWDEISEITERCRYDGSRLVVIAHTINLVLVPFLSSPDSNLLNRANSYSLPETPYHVPTSQHSPLPLLKSLSTISLNIHTKLTFNELGKITLHEDVIGLRETLTAIPALGIVYNINRFSIGVLINFAGKVFGGRKKKVGDEEVVEGGNGFGFGKIHRGNLVGPESEGLGMCMGVMGLGEPILIRKEGGKEASETGLTSVDLDQC